MPYDIPTYPGPGVGDVVATLDPVSQTETIPVEAALGRVLTRDQYAQATIPVARASAMDGVAVCAVRFGQGMPDTAGWKLGVDFCRTDTGDDFDDRFDAVIPIERVQISEKGQLTILGDMQVRPGDNIRPRGSAIRTGELVARKHRQLRPFDLACLAMGGIAQVEVYRRPRVAFIPTGSELVPWERRWAGVKPSIAIPFWPGPC